ncbi:hypothetical protein [Lacticaseibacillus suilingensis]|uniref:hypothetical protein n=1 Tax=Lacticaseibacillus suilingensis TaxID=2799577 RepID=UPI0022DEE26A|nr:hypothetical protein [Lacticaseibacillus suilingensis]
MFHYYRLTSRDYHGMIVRKSDDLTEEYFNTGTSKWEPIGIMTRYTWPESDTFEMYDELTEAQAKKLTV